MISKEMVKRAFDTNAWTYIGNSYGQAVAPAMFDEMVSEYQKKALVVAPLARQIDFRRPGSTWTVTVDVAPAVSALTAETAGAATSAITNRQVTFTPVEYTKKYEASYTEMEDGFLPFMANATEKIGYAMADQKDANAVSVLYSGATTALFVNSVSVATDLASTDTFNLDVIVDARKAIGKLLYRPYVLLIGRDQEADILKLSDIYNSNKFGSRDALINGLVGGLYGFSIYVSDNITATSNVEYALALGKTQTGEPAFAVAQARDPMVEMDKDITFRQVLVVGSERYDTQVIHPGAVASIGSYVA